MSNFHLPDQNQNFWQLASIQSASLGIPEFLLGGTLAASYGVGAALSSIFIGNLILWLIGLAMLGSTNNRKNAFEIVSKYLGKGGKLVFAFLVSCAFLVWYTLQAKAAASIITPFFSLDIQLQIRVGAILGLLIAMCSMGGIKLIKWLNIVGLPILFVFFLYLTFKNYQPLSRYNEVVSALSGVGIFSTIIINFPGFINLPTFFRHSRSNSHSFFGLSITIIFISAFQSFGIFCGITSLEDFFKINLHPAIIIGFSVLAVFCINTVNIYLASGAFEAVFKRAADARDYAVIGLIGTGGFALLQAAPVMSFIENSLNGFIACIGAVLVFMIALKILIKHRPQVLEKTIGNVAWILGSVISFIYLMDLPLKPEVTILSGIGVSILTLIIVLFVEESIWAYKHSSLKKHTEKR